MRRQEILFAGLENFTVMIGTVKSIRISRDFEGIYGHIGRAFLAIFLYDFKTTPFLHDVMYVILEIPMGAKTTFRSCGLRDIFCDFKTTPS